MSGYKLISDGFPEYREMMWMIFNNAQIEEGRWVKEDPQHMGIAIDFYIPEYKLYIHRDYVPQEIQDVMWTAGDRLIMTDERSEYARSTILDELNRFALKQNQANLPAILTPRIEGDAGWDIISSEDTVIAPGAYVDVPSELFMEMPNHIYGLVQARSSTSKKKILVLPGVIDPSFRGRVYAMVLNLSDEQIVIKRGDRIAQMLFMSRVQGLHRYDTTELRPSLRGENGFGSTGASLAGQKV